MASTFTKKRFKSKKKTNIENNQIMCYLRSKTNHKTLEKS